MDSQLQIHLLDQIIEPLSRCLTPEVARRVAELRATPSLQQRIDQLAEKCDQGELSEEEHSEYELYVVASSIIAILQAKARRVVAGQTAA